MIRLYIFLLVLYSCYNTTSVLAETYLINEKVLIEIPFKYNLDTTMMGLMWKEYSKNYIYINQIYYKENPATRNQEIESKNAKKMSKKSPNLEGRVSPLQFENLSFCYELEDRSKKDIEMVGQLVLNHNINITISYFKNAPYEIENVRNEYLTILKSLRLANSNKNCYKKVKYNGFGY